MVLLLSIFTNWRAKASKESGVVKISIQYHGKYVLKTGTEVETLYVSPKIASAVQIISTFLREEHGIQNHYLLFLNTMHVQKAIKENRNVEDGDTFKVIPFLSGG